MKMYVGKRAIYYYQRDIFIKQKYFCEIETASVYRSIRPLEWRYNSKKRQLFIGNAQKKEPSNFKFEDEGNSFRLSYRNNSFNINKSQVWAYVLPIAAVALASLTGVIVYGPLILGFIIFALFIFSTISVFAVVLGALLIIPIIMAALMAAGSAIGGLVISSSIIGVSWGLWTVIKSAMEKKPKENSDIELDQSGEENWMQALEEEDISAAQELLEFDKKLYKR